jgi:hypothetical protein
VEYGKLFPKSFYACSALWSLLYCFRKLLQKESNNYIFMYDTHLTRVCVSFFQTLLTNSILQQIKETFNMRMTWHLGVFRLMFSVEDGAYELYRRVPYDYDSEFQDIYYRIAMALIEGQINVHEALVYQREAKQGKHTAKSGLFIRNFPRRLILYPGQAATCAVIFFNGEWIDAGVAAICGLAAGLIDYSLSRVGGRATVLLDVLVGISTGVIGGLVFRWGPAGQDLLAWQLRVFLPCFLARFIGSFTVLPLSSEFLK